MRKYQLITIGLLICLLLVSGIGLAKTRSIYIGDIIRLKIENTELTAPEIKQKFKEQQFEIVNLEEQPTGYRLAVRNFEPGAKVIKLPNKKIKIDIKSTLEEKEQEQIYSSQLGIKEPDFSVPYHYFLYGLAVVAASGVVIMGWKFIKQKRKKGLTPYQQFHQELEEIDVETKNCLAHLTLAVKRYLEAEFDCRLAGKTAGEVVAEVSKLKVLGQYRTELKNWLEETAIYKYTQQQAGREKKQRLREDLIGLVEQIEDKRQETEEGQQV